MNFNAYRSETKMFDIHLVLYINRYSSMQIQINRSTGLYCQQTKMFTHSCCLVVAGSLSRHDAGANIFEGWQTRQLVGINCSQLVCNWFINQLTVLNQFAIILQTSQSVCNFVLPTKLFSNLKAGLPTLKKTKPSYFSMEDTSCWR